MHGVVVLVHLHGLYNDRRVQGMVVSVHFYKFQELGVFLFSSKVVVGMRESPRRPSDFLELHLLAAVKAVMILRRRNSGR